MRRTITALALTLGCTLALAAGPSQAALYGFEAILSGLNESPANASPATGYGFITFDDVAKTMQVDVTFDGLLGPNIAAHLHTPTTTPFTGTAPVATVTPTFTGFPSGATSGSYSHLFDLTSAGTYRAGYLAGFGGDTNAAGAALLTGALQGREYLNIHSTIFTGGEIRGFLTTAGVPEPGAWALMIAGFGLAGASLRRRRIGNAVN